MNTNLGIYRNLNQDDLGQEVLEERKNPKSIKRESGCCLGFSAFFSEPSKKMKRIQEEALRRLANSKF